MILDKAADDSKSKDKPDEDKKVVAGGIAITVVVLLLVGWTFFFFKRVQSGDVELQLGGAIPEAFYPASVRDAELDLMKESTGYDELLEARERSGSQEYHSAYQQEYHQDDIDFFGDTGAID